MSRVNPAGITLVLILILIGVALFAIPLKSKSRQLILDSFEGEIAKKTVDFGADANSSINVEAATDIKMCGQQSLKITYNLQPSGYMFCARGYGLDVLGSTWEGPAPDKITWPKYNAIQFSIYGAKKGTIAVDVKDAGGEMWRYLFEDNFEGWKEITVPFSKFEARSDWQPSTADNNKVLNFPLKSYQWEPRVPGEGILYFDCVKLVRLKSE